MTMFRTITALGLAIALVGILVGPTGAAVQLTQENGTLHVIVRDQGVGFDPKHLPQRSFGLRGIRERARLFGGTARIESRPGKGTTGHAPLPVDGSPPPTDVGRE